MRKGAFRVRLLVAALVFLFFACAQGVAAGYRTEVLSIRSRPQTIHIYEPSSGAAGKPFQVVVTSGDLGWIGISVDIAEKMRDLGYRTIGFNARAYLSSFTTKNSHLEAADVPGDYRSLMDWAARDSSVPGDFVMIGVSEGAGLAVVGMGQGRENSRCRGIVALGLPTRTSLGWRWTDFTMWITKKDPNEPMAETKDYAARLEMPVAMVHSTHDEYDSIEKARTMWALVPGPKDFLAVNAVNHRFSDKVGEVLAALQKFLLWMASSPPPVRHPSEEVTGAPGVRPPLSSVR